MFAGLHVKYKLFSSDFKETTFLEKFSKNSETSSFLKSFHEELNCSMATDRQTDDSDMIKLIIAFRIFSTPLKRLLS